MRLVCLAVVLAVLPSVRAADWPQFGRASTRNAVSPETGVTLDFAFAVKDEAGKVTPSRNVAWTAELGDQTLVPPVVAGGLVWVCTNGGRPADETIADKDWDGGVLTCLRETDGKPLWRQRTPRLDPANRAGDRYSWPLASVPLIEDDRLWFVNTRSEVVGLDIAPLKKQTGTPTEVWKLDLRKDLGVFANRGWCRPTVAAAVAGYKDKLYVVTHNGVGDNGYDVPAPDAPSLVCLEKATGKVVWKDSSPGKGILHLQVSSPLVCEVGGRPQVIVGQGDGWLRSFDPATGRVLWTCDLNPKAAKFEIGGGGDRNYVVASPILYDGRVYVATGHDPEHWTGVADLYCIDPTKDGDVSLELPAGLKKGKPNPNAAVVWRTPRAVPADAPRVEVVDSRTKKKVDLFRESREFFYARTVATPTAHDGLLYTVDIEGIAYCFDAKTGKLYWVENLKYVVWGQPLWADGKVFIATAAGDLFVFAHGKEKKLLAKVECDSAVYAGPVFGNGTLYVTGESKLHAVRRPK